MQNSNNDCNNFKKSHRRKWDMRPSERIHDLKGYQRQKYKKIEIEYEEKNDSSIISHPINEE
jgi:hypothetical protein